jgi:WD40 repeat protein
VDGGRENAGVGAVKLWRLSTGRESVGLVGEVGKLHGIAFSPDGSRLAAACEDGTIPVWDATTGNKRMTLHGHTRPVRRVAFGPDGERLASASEDGTVKLWDVQTGAEVLSLDGHTDGVFDVAFDPSGRQLATAGADRTVKVWDATPLSAEALEQREARSLVHFLSAQQLPKEEALDRVRRSAGITEAVRQRAVDLIDCRAWQAGAR